MPVLKIPRLLLISGNGRNSGKTTFACRVIGNLCRQFPIVAVKISPHLYSGDDNLPDPDKFTVTIESERYSGKDSSRMLAAGAVRSYFISAPDDRLESVSNRLIEIAGNNSYIICESGGLRHRVEPALFLILNGKDNREMKPGILSLLKSDPILISYDGDNFDLDPQRITIDEMNEKWIIL